MNNTKVFFSIVTGLLVFSLLVKAQETKGTPGVDYPNYDTIPKTSFSCSKQKYVPGFYADMETDCQVFHFCVESRQESFLCPTGTTFNQASLTCDSWEMSNCSLAPLFYKVNSGPEMENARRNILMVLNLRNRSRSRPSIGPSANVYEKITSLYDNIVDESQSKFPDVTVAINAESNDISQDLSSQKTPEEVQEEIKVNVSHLIEDLAGLDEGIQGESTNGYSTGTQEVHGSEDLGPNIFYDPVTENYYVDYEASKAVNEDTEDVVDQFNSFNHGSFGKRYDLAYSGYVDEMLTDSENYASNERENNIEELNEILGTAEPSEMEFLRRLLNPDQPTRRTRRKPLYTVIQDDEVSIKGVERGVKYPIVDSDYNRFKTESLKDTEVNFDLPEANISEGDELQDIVDSQTHFESSDELQNPNTESIHIPKVPQTSEEFEQAILSELVSPGIYGLGLGRSFPSEEEQRDEESSENVSEDYQNDGQYSFIENVNPADYELYSSEYNEANQQIVGVPGSDQETRYNEESNEWYQDEQSVPVEDSESDTYVVIPDEYDANVLGEYSETEERYGTYNAQDDDATDSYDAWRDSILQGRNYPILQDNISPELFTPVGPYWFSQPGYFPDEYGRPRPFAGRDFIDRFLQSPGYEDSEMPNDQAYQYGFADNSQEGYSSADSGSYADEPPSFPGHVYDYMSGGMYPYESVYGNPYIGNYVYESSEVEDADNPSLLNEGLDAAVTGNGDYSESEMQSWFQSDSAESSKTEEEEREVTESSLSTEDFAEFYATSRTSGDLNVMPQDIVDVPFENEDMKQAETFYLFDFDEDSEEQVKLDATDEVPETDTEQFDLTELFQTEHPLPPNDSFEGDSKGMNVESESTQIQEISNEGFDQENVASPGDFETSESAKSKIDARLFQTAQNTLLNDSPVNLSALENLAALNIARTSRRSDAFNNVYPESDSRLKDAVDMNRQYGTEDVSRTPSLENELDHRTGDTRLPRISKLSEIQDRIRSLKHGKFGAFKKYINSAGNKN